MSGKSISPIVFRVEKRRYVDLKHWCVDHIQRGGGFKNASHIDASGRHQLVYGLEKDALLARVALAIQRPDKDATPEENAGKIGFARMPKDKGPEQIAGAATEVVITADGDFMRHRQKADPDYYRKFDDRAVAYLSKLVGAENVLQVYAHDDEQTHHVHALILPVAELERNGRKKKCLSHYTYFQDPHFDVLKWRMEGTTHLNSKLGKLQTEIAEYFADLHLVRGQESRLGAKNPGKPIHRPKPIHVNMPIVPKVAIRDEISQAALARAEEVERNFAGWPTQEGIAKLIQEAFDEGVAARDRLNAEVRGPLKKQIESLAMENNELKAGVKNLADELREKNKMLKKACEERQRQTEIMRGLPMDDVAGRLGLEYDPYSQVWRGCGCKLSIKKSTGEFKDWHADKKGNQGPISLVMHVMECDFNGAHAWLKAEYGIDGASRAFVAQAAADAQRKSEQASEKPFSRPIPFQEENGMAVEKVKKFLWKRGINPSQPVVHDQIEQGRIYLARMRSRTGHLFENVIFCSNHESAEVRGTNAQYPFKGMAVGSHKDRGPAFEFQQGEAGPVVVFESALDALAFAQLYPTAEFLAVSASGARPDIGWLDQYIDQGRKIFIAFDADAAGDKMADRLIKNLNHRHPEETALLVKRLRPKAESLEGKDNGKSPKDWNDMLLRPDMTGKEERDGETLDEQIARFRREDTQRQLREQAERKAREEELQASLRQMADDDMEDDNRCESIPLRRNGYWTLDANGDQVWREV
jgi:hypothetical protein